LTYGFTYCAGISFTSCPSAVSSRAQWCEEAQASMPTKQPGCFAKNGKSCERLICRRTMTSPAASTPWTWNTDLARSRPTVTT